MVPEGTEDTRPRVGGRPQQDTAALGLVLLFSLSGPALTPVLVAFVFLS